MPLIRGHSDATRSRNIAILQREGYSFHQSAAIAYKIQHEEVAKMHSKKAALRRQHRRDRGLAYANPMAAAPVAEAIGYLGVSAAFGGALGGLGGAMAKTPNVIAGAVSGASVSVGLTALTGFIYGLVKPEKRDVAFATAGIGLGSLILMNLATAIAVNASKT